MERPEGMGGEPVIPAGGSSGVRPARSVGFECWSGENQALTIREYRLEARLFARGAFDILRK